MATMDFGDILNQWENETSKAYGKKKLTRNKKLAEKYCSNKSIYDENKQKAHPVDLWIRKHGVENKDAISNDFEKHKKTLHGKAFLQRLPVDDRIDLHGMTCDEAESVLRQFFNKAVANNFNKVLIVHGKGNHSKTGAVLAPFVRNFLEQHKHAGETGHPKPADGGTGSTWVMIK